MRHNCELVINQRRGGLGANGLNSIRPRYICPESFFMGGRVGRSRHKKARKHEQFALRISRGFEPVRFSASSSFLLIVATITVTITITITTTGTSIVIISSGTAQRPGGV